MKRKNSTYNLSKDTYQSIEFMPIWNWNKIMETRDLKYLFLTGEGVVNKKLGDLWDKLQDEYIKIFGLDEKFLKRLKLLKEKARLNYEFVETKNRFLNTLLSIVDADLKELDSGVSIEFYELKSHLEKHKGYRIDPKTTTVIEWNYDLKSMTNG